MGARAALLAAATTIASSSCIIIITDASNDLLYQPNFVMPRQISWQLRLRHHAAWRCIKIIRCRGSPRRYRKRYKEDPTIMAWNLINGALWRLLGRTADAQDRLCPSAGGGTPGHIRQLR